MDEKLRSKLRGLDFTADQANALALLRRAGALDEDASRLAAFCGWGEQGPYDPPDAYDWLGQIPSFGPQVWIQAVRCMCASTTNIGLLRAEEWDGWFDQLRATAANPESDAEDWADLADEADAIGWSEDLIQPVAHALVLLMAKAVTSASRGTFCNCPEEGLDHLVDVESVGPAVLEEMRSPVRSGLIRSLLERATS